MRLSASALRASGLPNGLSIAVAVLVIDQITKWFALTQLMPYRPLDVLPMVNLTLAFNTGAAFSLLADSGGWQRWALSAVAVGVSMYLVGWLRGLGVSERLQITGLGLILGGALGNLADRLARGAVIDFIDVHYQGWHWPAFNIADSAITLGVAAVLLSVVRQARHERKHPAE